MKWSELKAQGVSRCCVMFKDGSRCRRRAITTGFEGTWCAKHGPIMQRHTDAAIKALKTQAVADSTADNGDDR